MPLADRFTDLLTAWSTLGGAVGSILAVVVAYLLLRKEIRSRNDEKRDAEASVARLVMVVVERPPIPRSGATRMNVIVRNHGAEPILDVEVSARLASDEFRRRLHYLDPHAEDRGLAALDLTWRTAGIGRPPHH